MMLTSSGRYDDVERCRELGIAAYLTKPIAPSDLHRRDPSRDGSGGAGRIGDRAGDRADRPPRRRTPRKVLLAEDNVVNQRVAVGLLNRRGHHVTVVEQRTGGARAP